VRLPDVRLSLLVLLAPLLAVLGPGFAVQPASALSCIDPGSAALRADHLFTGRITDAQDGRILVDVGEIWNGGPMAATVWLAAELDGWWDGLENGRIPDGYSSPTTWLFASRANATGAQSVNPCTAWPTTTPWGTHLRPASVTMPLSPSEPRRTATRETSADDDTGLPVMAGSLAAFAGAVVLGRLAVRRRRRPQLSG
jgi:MYXO-CTERM domain-containing protein